ncbi:MAG: NfeD family protein [Acidobacteriota bacterium]|jgi:membrane protein implicated in regulation of membrane protease activity|nr:NfeD family protein [Acidobacteriota bacterium]
MHVELWWLWMGLAALFLVGEIFTVGFFLFWFAVGAAVAGVLAMLGVGEPGQLIAFILVSATLFAFGRRFAERVTAKQPPGIGADRFIGATGVVTEAIDPSANTGDIRIGPEQWRATSDDGKAIPAGASVQVLRIDGVHAVVKVTQPPDGAEKES